MKLQKASIWVTEHFTPDSQPCLRTLRKWVECGILTGQVIDKQLYIDKDAFTLDAAKRQEFKHKTRNRFEFIQE